jgi:hypothetical protein
MEIDSFLKHIIHKDRNNAGGGLLIYFKDYISAIRKNTDITNTNIYQPNKVYGSYNS